jgi:hypothetical protein
MSKNVRCILLVAGLCGTLTLVTCKPEMGPTSLPVLKGGPPTAVVPITLDTDSGLCTQNGVEGGNVVMGSPGVSWSGAGGQTIEVHFAAGCMFANGCDYGPGPGPFMTGRSNYPVTTSVRYSSIKVNNSPCNSMSDGLIMR